MIIETQTISSNVMNFYSPAKLTNGETIEAIDAKSIRKSPLAEALFDIGDISSVLISPEMVSVTKEGYIKRTSLRSYSASKPTEIGIKEGDYPIYIQQLNTLNHLLIFTSKGNIIYRPIHEISDLRWKDMGDHLSQNIAFETDETVVKVFGLEKQLPPATFTFITKEGYIKQTAVSEYVIGRNYKNKSFFVVFLQKY